MSKSTVIQRVVMDCDGKVLTTSLDDAAAALAAVRRFAETQEPITIFERMGDGRVWREQWGLLPAGRGYGRIMRHEQMIMPYLGD